MIYQSIYYDQSKTMNYQQIHDDIIAGARGRINEDYTENHHIIPRCMGGDDSPENLVRLTAREHFVIHQLLVKLHPHIAGLVASVRFMTAWSPTHHRDRSKNRFYSWIRKRNQKAAIKLAHERWADATTITKNLVLPLFIDGVGLSDISKQTGVSPATVGNTIYREYPIIKEYGYIENVRRVEDEIDRLFTLGKTPVETSKLLGIKKSTVYAAINRLYPIIKQYGPATRLRNKREAQRLYALGETMENIATALNMSRSNIMNYLPRRPRRTRQSAAHIAKRVESRKKTMASRSTGIITKSPLDTMGERV